MTTRRMSNRWTSWLFATLLLALGPVGAASAQVKVTATDPAETTQGTVALDVTISGSGFDSTAAVSFLVTGTTNPGGIVVRKVVVHSSKKLVVTIDAADSAVLGQYDIEIRLSSGRKGKGTTLFLVKSKNSDPCASSGLDFPAFVFWRPVGGAGAGELVVADATGTCVRKLQDNPTSRVARFSYPVDGQANKGRVVWGQFPTMALDFTVGAGNSITVDAPRAVDAGCCVTDLSLDGRDIFFIRDGNAITRMEVDSPESETVLHVLSEPDWVIGFVTVNGDGTQAFGHKGARGYDNPDRGHVKLVRIDLTTGSETVLRDSREGAGYDSHIFDPATDKRADRVAFVDFRAGTDRCAPIVVTDFYGAELYRGSDASGGVGKFPTWVGNGLVTGLMQPSTGRYECRTPGLIGRIDLATGGVAELTTGQSPDGR